MLADIEPQMQEVIGYLETDWKRSYTQESNLGQWQADAIRKKNRNRYNIPECRWNKERFTRR